MNIIHEMARRIAQSRTLGPLMARTARTTLNLHRGFTFDPAENGEHALVEAVLAFRSAPPEPFTFFDVGAHRGTWTEHVLRRLGGDRCAGHLFEPTPTMVAELERRFSGVQGVRVHAHALADRAGTHRLVVRSEGGESNSLFSDDDRLLLPTELTTLDMEVTTGDAAIREFGVDRIHLLKIDTEGWDLEVLRGFREALVAGRIEVVQFEYALPNARTRRLMTDFYAFLEPLGFAVGALRPDGVRFAPFTLHANHFDSGPNYVAAREPWVEALRRF